jgi:hypothetical protein
MEGSAMPKRTPQPTPTTREDSERTLFSFDLGNGFCKVRSADVAAEYRAIYGALSRRNTLVNAADRLVISFENNRYVFGDDTRLLCDTEPTALTSRIRYTSDRYRLLFASALWRTFTHWAGEGVLYPRGVLSIPVGEFNVQKDKEVRELLAGEYTIHGLNGATLYAAVRPSDLIIIPEGLGTFWLEAFNPDGSLHECYAKGSTAVVDIGYYTTDVVLLQDGIYVVGGAQSADIGMGTVALNTLEALRREGAYGLDIWQVDGLLGERQVEVNGRVYPLADTTHAELAALAERVVNFMESTLRGKSMRTVILGGGGADLLLPYIAANTRADLKPSADARRGNVEGAYAFLLLRERGGA